ncbi:MAG: TldD/PmbA family protein [Thermoplasmata archaeon]|jgi:predicted Zn-dependent protease
MTPPTSDLAFRVAEKLHLEVPWDVYAEHLSHYEVHFDGTHVETVRGPIAVDGYGIRIFRAVGDEMGVGYQAGNDASPAGIAAVLSDAEATARHARFPARTVALPVEAARRASDVEIFDATIAQRPSDSVEEYVQELFRCFEGRNGAVPSFGSTRLTVGETTIANSFGLEASFQHTDVDFEVAVKAFGGPEGRPPGEYWVTRYQRRLDRRELAADVDLWCQRARDVRRAQPPPAGQIPVLLPAYVLADIIPSVVGFRLSGTARLRQMSPEPGTMYGNELVSIDNDGRLAWGGGSAPVDDEGTRTGRFALLDHGKTGELIYDALHAGAFDRTSSAGAARMGEFGRRTGPKFAARPTPGPATLAVHTGTGGTDAEMIEALGDGIWVEQFGWAFPDPASGAFGGEIRIGYRVRNGKIAEPIRGGTVGGLVVAPPGTPSLLNSVRALGSRASLCDALYAPTIAVTGLTVAGVT